MKKSLSEILGEIKTRFNAYKITYNNEEKFFIFWMKGIKDDFAVWIETKDSIEKKLERECD